MSYQAVEHVLAHSPSRLAARLVELVLASHAHPDGTNAWPSVVTIAREARLSERAVREALASLRRAGLIVDVGESPRRTRVYSVAQAAYGPVEGANGAGVQTVQGASSAGERVQTAPPEGADGAAKPELEPSLNHPSAPRALDDVAAILNTARRPKGKTAHVNRGKLATLLAEHPDKAHLDAAHETVEWSTREPLHSVLAGYRSVLESAPDTDPPPPEPEPPSDDTTARWSTAQARLRDLVGEDYDLWLADLELVGQDEDCLVLAMPANRAGWFERFSTPIATALEGKPFRLVHTEQVTA